MRLSKGKKSGRRRRRWWRISRRLLKWVGLISLGFYALCLAGLLFVKFFQSPLTAVQLERDVEACCDGTSEAFHSTFVPLSQISVNLQHAVIAGEDGRFYQHSGIDWLELRKAVHADLRRGELWRGGSTITQQLVKNLFLTTRFGVLRKCWEFILAPSAEIVLSKRRILELYLNVIEWGPGIFGAEAAARTYYGIPASQLDREQAARLAACLPAPRLRRPRRMDEYSAEILERMTRMGW